MKKFYKIKLTIIELTNDNETECSKNLQNEEKIKVIHENIIVHKVFRGFKEILTGVKLYPITRYYNQNKCLIDSNIIISDYKYDEDEVEVRYLKEYKFFIMVEPFYFENPLIFATQSELNSYINDYNFRISTKYFDKVKVKRKVLKNMQKRVERFKDNNNL